VAPEPFSVRLQLTGRSNQVYSSVASTRASSPDKCQCNTAKDVIIADRLPRSCLLKHVKSTDSVSDWPSAERESEASSWYDEARPVAMTSEDSAQEDDEILQNETFEKDLEAISEEDDSQSAPNLLLDPSKLDHALSKNDKRLVGLRD